MIISKKYRSVMAKPSLTDNSPSGTACTKFSRVSRNAPRPSQRCASQKRLNRFLSDESKVIDGRYSAKVALGAAHVQFKTMNCETMIARPQCNGGNPDGVVFDSCGNFVH